MDRYDTDNLDLLLQDVKLLLGEEPCQGDGQKAETRPIASQEAVYGRQDKQEDTFNWAAQNFIDEDIGPYYTPDSTSVDRWPVAERPSQAQRAVKKKTEEHPFTHLDSRQEQRQTADFYSESGKWGKEGEDSGKSSKSRSKSKADWKGDAQSRTEMSLPPESGGKKVRRIKKLIITLFILLLIVGAGSYFFLARQPMAQTGGLGERKAGVSTILLAGTDGDGMRTDTIMLLNINSLSGQVNLVSIPRDTLVNGGYSVPKINSAYGWAGEGKSGMEELMERVTEIIGFRPDGYLLINLDSFVELVDLMGGITFDVPVDMQYSDPAQDLYIDLQSGEQTLSGEQAMGLVRFRSGYTLADLERVNVQRDFVCAAAEQWVNLKNITKIPGLLAWYGGNVTTDLSVGNMAWIGLSLLRADLDMAQTETMPGTARNISGGSYYCLDTAAVVETVNTLLNPYQEAVTEAGVQIRVG